MFKRLVASLAVVGTALTAFLTGIPAAQASTGGTPDGELHPSVGMIVFYDADGRFRCSATQVSPTVLLTAAHCTKGTLGLTLVTFESVIAEAPPSPLPAAADPSKGYTEADLAGYAFGTAYAHPAYSDFTDLKNWNDVGVVVLSKPLDHATSELAPLNRLDQIASGQLNKTIFTGVGYGTEVRKPDEGPQKPSPMSYPLIRRWWEVPGQKLTPQILQVNGNPNDVRGTGGSCFGDSGGPLFLDNQIVAVTSYGYTANCRYLDGYQRVDIPVVQDWLAEFGVTP
ncbi:pterin-4-alpha-carbinolamine dehydratase [Arthrobacter sp. SW1]|uniref:trypsin-like serine protease n=1 Tax=Arthrobacter sp. SW1 TaxID=1920889 RepID=UPI000877B1FB|nr:trypsin-like serine protease [Arthrobacter sp. SW1]OFI37676.1 pterin-4-alpha-carbinolamine dehydratase [Arthrobacter sp. SW1]